MGLLAILAKRIKVFLFFIFLLQFQYTSLLANSKICRSNFTQLPISIQKRITETRQAANKLLQLAQESKFSEEFVAQIRQGDFQLWKQAIVLNQALGRRKDNYTSIRLLENKIKQGLNPAHLFHSSKYAYKAVYSGGQRIIGDPSTKNSHIQLFRSSFHSYPIRFFSEGIPREGIGHRAQLFVMHVPESQVRGFSFLKDPPSYRHLEDAFAYIRYYEYKGNIYITEIQSEVFGKLPLKSEIRKKYKDWSKLLVLQFLQFLEQQKFRSYIGNIYIAGKNYQEKRWEEAEYSKALFRVIYEQLPKSMKFQKGKKLKEAFEWPEHLQTHEDNTEIAFQKIPIGEAWVLQSENISKTPFFQELKKVTRVSLTNPYLQVMEEVGPSIDLLRPDKNTTSDPPQMQSIKEFQIIPYSQEPLDRVPFINSSTLRFWANTSLRRLPEDLLVSLDTTTYLSTRKGNYSLEDITNAFKESSKGSPVVHNILNQRTPHYPLRTKFLAIKGGGALRGITLEDFQLGGDKNLAFRPNIAKTRVLDSHKVWGGLSKEEAGVELINELILLELMAKRSGPQEAFAIPLDIGKLSYVPIGKGGKTQILSAKEYAKRFLPNLPNYSFYQYRSLVKSPLRISGLLMIMHNVAQAKNIDSEKQIFYKEATLNLLKHIYSVYGKKLQVPGRLPKIQDYSSLMIFLDRIFQNNTSAAKDILHTFTYRSLRAIAIVHAEGGHLGGKYHLFLDGIEGEPIFNDHLMIGAPNGGATALRNITVAGELRDLDTSLYLPWSPSYQEANPSQYRNQLQQLNLKEMQRSDLQYWSESHYWFRLFIEGRTDLRPGQIPPESLFGELVVIPYDENWKPRFDYKLELSRLPFGHNLKAKGYGFSSSKFEDIYKSAWPQGMFLE